MWDLLKVLVPVLLALFGMMAALIAWFADRVAKGIDRSLDELKAAIDREALRIGRVENQVLEMRAQLPENYVRREDWLRNHSVIEARLDLVFEKLERLFNDFANHARRTGA